MCSCPQTTSQLNLHLIIQVHLPNHTPVWACSLFGLWRLVFISPCELALGIMGSRKFGLWPTIFWNLQIPQLVFSGYGFDINNVFGFLLQHSIVLPPSSITCIIICINIITYMIVCIIICTNIVIYIIVCIHIVACIIVCIIACMIINSQLTLNLLLIKKLPWSVHTWKFMDSSLI